MKFFFFVKELKYILLYLIPFFLITGPFLGDLSTSLVGLIFIIICIYEKNFKYFRNIYSIIFFSFCIYLIILSLFSDNIYLSLQSSLFYFRFGLLALAIWFSLENNSKFSYNFTISLIFCFIILFSDAYYQFFTGKNILGWARDSLRLTSFFGSEYILGSYLSRFFPLLIALCLINFSKKKIDITIAIIFLILSDIIIFLTGERVAFLNLLLSTIIMIVLFEKYRKIRFFSFIISIIIITLITFSFPDVKNRMIDQTKRDLTDNIEDKNLHFNYLSNTHEKIYLTTIKIANDNLIFGIGPKIFREECQKKEYFIIEGCSTHPHNNFLQLLAETGLFGALLYIGVFLYVSIIFFKVFISKYFSYKKFYIPDYKICLFLTIFVNFFPLFPSGNFFNNWLSIIYFIPFGFILYSIKK